MLYLTIYLSVILFTGAAAQTVKFCRTHRDCRNGGSCQLLSSPKGRCLCASGYKGPFCEDKGTMIKHDFDTYNELRPYKGIGQLKVTETKSGVPNAGYNGSSKFGAAGPGKSFELRSLKFTNDMESCAEFGYYISGTKTMLEARLHNLEGDVDQGRVWEVPNPSKQLQWLYAKFQFRAKKGMVLGAPGTPGVDYLRASVEALSRSVFKGTTGDEAMSGLAIDEISISEGPCQ